MFRKETRVRFKTPFINVGSFEAAGVNGKTGKIKQVFSKPDATHDRECLPMYRIRLDDGREIEAFWEELRRVKSAPKGGR